MAGPKPNPNTPGNQQLKQAAVALTNHACTLSMQHIQDGMLRLQFNREVAYYARGIVRDVEGGKKSFAQGVKELEGERQSLLDQVITYGKQVFGLAGGVAQVAAGASLCYGSGGLACVGGAYIAVHGANNIYENGANLLHHRSDTEGWARNAYQSISSFIGGSDYEGNMIYGTVDLVMSGWGLFKLVPKKDAWRLYRYIRADKEIAIKQIAPELIILEAGASTSTIHSMQQEWKNKNE